MASLEEVLNSLSETDYRTSDIQFEIDENLRVVSIPALGVVAGVTGDKDVNRINFKMVRYFDGLDMSQFEIRINYVNANGDENFYVADDKEVASDYMLFSWLVGYDATAYAGSLTFCVYLLKTASDGTLQKAFKSAIGTISVIEGIDVNSQIEPEEIEDVYDRCENMLIQKGNEIINPATDAEIKEFLNIV